MSDQQLERYGLHQLESEVKEPDMFRVSLLNDHYTTQEFVVEILVKVFHKEQVEAMRIMLDVHEKGRGTVGLYPFDIAATRVRRVKELARKNEFPLECLMEKA